MANKKRQTGITPQMVREARGIRLQKDCAELIGVTPRQFGQYERGDCDIKLRDYKLLMATNQQQYSPDNYVVTINGVVQNFDESMFVPMEQS